MNVALLGHGTVGKGVTDIIENEKIEGIHIVRILTRTKRENNDERFTVDFGQIINDETIDTIVECMGGEEPAYSYVKECLEKGKNVISANKKMLARHMDLFELAKERNVKLLVEASTAGGIPWIRNLCDISRDDSILSIQGIFNGTSNYILSRIFEEDMSFEDALFKAQELGFAEADPSDDVCGNDVRYKVCIAILAAFGKIAKEEQIFARGIDHLSSREIAYAGENDMVIKLIGQAGYNKGKLSACVLPHFVTKGSLYSCVGGNDNLCVCQSKYLGKLSLIGQGAGSYPTGHSILQDLIDVRDKRAYEWRIEGEEEILQDIEAEFYISSDHFFPEELIKERIDESSFLSRKCRLCDLMKYLEEEDFIAIME